MSRSKQKLEEIKLKIAKAAEKNKKKTPINKATLVEQEIESTRFDNLFATTKDNSTKAIKRLQKTFYLEKEVIVMIEKIAINRFFETNKKPEYSDLVNEAIKDLFQKQNLSGGD